MALSLGGMLPMDIRAFLESPALALPKTRLDGDFLLYLRRAYNDFLQALDALDTQCHVCAAVRQARADAEQLARWVTAAVRQYYLGQPERAYTQLAQGLEFAAARITNLFSQGIDGDAIEPLYRMTRLAPNQLAREFMFHWPFELRGRIGKHRYGIPGFPCLYLGGSLRVCQIECRIPDQHLPQVAVSRFAPRHKVQVLDFGYRPTALVPVAAGLALGAAGSNPPLLQLIVNYITCWPLVMAASVCVLYETDHFYPEYVVPHLITQWLTRNTTCDGIRYFSTRFNPDPQAIRSTANYVFPARDLDNQAGHCGRLKRMFALTQPYLWRNPTSGADLPADFQDNESHLSSLPLAPLP